MNRRSFFGQLVAVLTGTLGLGAGLKNYVQYLKNLRVKNLRVHVVGKGFIYKVCEGTAAPTAPEYWTGPVA